MKLFSNNNFSNTRRIITLFGCAVLLVYAVVYLIGYKMEKSNEASAVSLETTLSTVNTVDESIEEAEDTISEASVEDVDDSLVLADADEVVDVNYYDIVYNTIEQIRNGDEETITRLFGESDVFTSDVVADRVQATNIQEVNTMFNDDGSVEVIIHVCTIDYNLMNNDYAAIEASEKQLYIDEHGEILEGDTTYIDNAKRKLAENFTDGNYDVCYNVPVMIEDMQVKATESFKMAITGGWYTGIGVNLINTPCNK